MKIKTVCMCTSDTQSEDAISTKDVSHPLNLVVN